MKLIEQLEYKLAKCQLANSHIIINEHLHVADGMDEVVGSMTDDILDFMLKLNKRYNVKKIVKERDFDKYKEIDDYVRSFGMIYSGYNFNPNFRTEIKQNLLRGIKPEPCLRLDDESIPYPIQYTFIFEKSENLAGAIDRMFSDENDNDKIITIIINLANFATDLMIHDEWRLRSTLAHEFQHVFDMYILPNDNFIVHQKCSGLTLSLQDYRYSMDKDVYRECNKLLSMISSEEIRGRLAELSELLKIIENNRQLADRLFYHSINRVYPIRFKRFEHPFYGMSKEDIFQFIASSRTFQSITRINYFRGEMIDFLTSDDVKMKESVVLTVGYFLYKSNSFKVFGEEKALLNKLYKSTNFIKEYTVNGIIKDEYIGKFTKQYDYVANFIKDEFCHYVALVNGTLLNNLPNMFDIHNIKEMYPNAHDFDNWLGEIFIVPLS